MSKSAVTLFSTSINALIDNKKRGGNGDGLIRQVEEVFLFLIHLSALPFSRYVSTESQHLYHYATYFLINVKPLFHYLLLLEALASFLSI